MTTNVNVFPSVDGYSPAVREDESWFDLRINDSVGVCVFGENMRDVRSKLGRLLDAVSQAVVRMDLRMRPKEGEKSNGD